jgi:hypothetical protein
MMEMFPVPWFGKMRLDRITDEDIDCRPVNFAKRERRRLCKKIAPDSTGVTLAADMRTVLIPCALHECAGEQNRQCGEYRPPGGKINSEPKGF